MVPKIALKLIVPEIVAPIVNGIKDERYAVLTPPDVIVSPVALLVDTRFWDVYGGVMIAPAGPVAPVAPVFRAVPIGPVHPVAPVGPVDPVGPTMELPHTEFRNW